MLARTILDGTRNKKRQDAESWQPAELKELKRKFGWAGTDFADFSGQ
ncbi:MAG: hypothetical protein ACYCZ6_12110 [Polaromonas sp.]